MPFAPLLADEAALGPCFDSIPTLSDLPDRCETALAILARETTRARGAERPRQPTRSFESAHWSTPSSARLPPRGRSSVVSRCSPSRRDGLFEAMEFGFLFDPGRQLLSIGYRVADGELDPSCYDLLASEARLASFVAIAKGDVPVRHWFRLGRALTPVDHGSALISWSGSMFEYLMPSLVMRAPAGSLLEQTSRFIVRRQMRYGGEAAACPGAFRNRPTTRATSSSPISTRTSASPASVSSAVSAKTPSSLPTRRRWRRWWTRRPRRGTSRAWRAAGGRGRYGWYEALDYTPTRLPEGEAVAIVRAYMAHHQGMTLVAIANALQDGAMRARFHADPIVRATELLLQERTPRDVAVARPRAEEVNAAAERARARSDRCCAASIPHTTRRPARTFSPTAATP